MQTKLPLLTIAIAFLLVSPACELTPTPEPTATPTPTNTATANASPTATETPHFSAQEFIEWTGQIKGCEPPCVWDITPGKTSVEELYEILGPFGDISKFEKDDGRISYTFFIEETYTDNQKTRIGSVFSGSETLIEEIFINAGLLHPKFDATLSHLLLIWGIPSEIWLQVHIEKGLPATYDTQLVFPNIPVIVKVIGGQLVPNENGHEFCPQRIGARNGDGPGFLFWDHKLDTNIENLTNLAGYEPLTNFNLEYDNETFWEVYKEANASNCIELSE